MKNLKIQSRFAAILLLPLCWCIATYGQITPSDDAYTSTSASTTNYGTATTLSVSTTTTASTTSFIRFDLSSIPPTYTGANIAQATLKMYVNTVTTAGSFNVDYITGAWSEKTIKETTEPGIGSTIVSNVNLATTQKGEYVLIDVTPALVAWLDGTETNYGLALVANSPLSATFDSKENTAASHPSELDVVYAGIAGVTTASGSGLTGGGTTGTLNLALTNSCATNQVLQWNGSSWACAAVGTGTVTNVSSGTGLLGGPITGSGTLSLNTAMVPLLNTPNTFNGNQAVNGSMSATVVNASASYDLGGYLVLYGSYNYGNVFLGFGNAANPTAGSFNTAVGSDVMYGLTTGGSNSAFGDAALVAPGSGSDNTAVGVAALGVTSSSYNTGVGVDAGKVNQTGQYNTYLGSEAGALAGNVTNASYSAAIGANAIVSASNAMALGAPGAVSNGSGQVNVGIGTAAPQYRLDVSYGDAIVRGAGNFSSVANLFVGDTAHEVQAVTGVGIGLGAFSSLNTLVVTDNFGGGSNGCQYGFVGIRTSCPTSLLTLAQGQGAAIADGWNTYSSRRWKTNIQPLHNALNTVEQLRGVSYDLKDSGKHEIGVIAEEVGAVVPELVSFENNGKDARGVDYSRLTALLIEAVKQQQQQIREQRRQIESQQRQITRLSSKVGVLETSLRTTGSAEKLPVSIRSSASAIHAPRAEAKKSWIEPGN